MPLRNQTKIRSSRCAELTILNATIGGGHFWVAALFLIILAVIFIGMGAVVLGVVQGEPPPGTPPGALRESWSTGAPVVVLMAMVLLLGVYLPPPVADLVAGAARFLGQP